MLSVTPRLAGATSNPVGQLQRNHILQADFTETEHTLLNAFMNVCDSHKAVSILKPEIEAVT